MKNNTMDWNLELNNAIENKPTREKYIQLHTAASNWVKCAVGNQCSIIPRDSDDAPIDKELNDLGLDFCININDWDWITAKETLKAIEERSAFLIAKLTV